MYVRPLFYSDYLSLEVYIERLHCFFFSIFLQFTMSSPSALMLTMNFGELLFYNT